MALKSSLRVHQSQQLALTPGLRQSLAILQMSGSELADLVQQELDQNPLLTAETHYAPRGQADYAIALETVAAQKSLHERLRDQIALIAAPHDIRALAEYLAADLDESGFLGESQQSLILAGTVTNAQMTAAIRLLQSCEPVGIGARDLRDCFDLQMAALGENDENRAFVVGNLAAFANSDLTALSRLHGPELPEIQRLAAILRQLNPTPGQTDPSGIALPLFPEIMVTKTADGGFSVDLTASTLPSLKVETSQLHDLHKKDPETLTYLTENNAKANSLIRAITARSKTILRIAHSLVALQSRFFIDGPAHLVPLTQVDLAAEMGLHPSTIARGIAEKSLVCEFGSFPLTFFFARPINSLDGGAGISPFVVQQRIAKLIGAETRENVLSDATIATFLRESGVDISRRTVAKYRQCLKISSSAQRRRSKRFL